MRLRFTYYINFILLFSLLAITSVCYAQTSKKVVHKKSNKKNITGIWRGHFVQKQFNPFAGKFVEDTYRYEVQINNSFENNKLEGVTYSYQTKRFYGKTSLQGIFNDKTNNILIKENKMLELKMADASGEPCLMTCYLTYTKDGDKEILKGEYSSQNMKNKSACGDGTVYLEKVPESDFTKEDFLIKKNAPVTQKSIAKKIPSTPKSKSTTGNTISKEKITNKKTTPLVKKTAPATQKSVAKKNPTTPKSKYRPGAESALIKKDNKSFRKPQADTTNAIVKQETSTEKPITTTSEITVTPNKILPKVLTERKNNLVKTFYVDEGELELEIYDNGQIDNDSISVFHNGEPVILHERLSTIPIKLKIKVTAANPVHELILVADNLGEIPPNTSLMKVTAGKKNYQVFLTSDLQKNAKIIFEYSPQNGALNNKK